MSISVQACLPRAARRAAPLRTGFCRVRLRARRCSLARARRSAVSPQMAAVALPFVMLLFGTFEVAFDLYLQSAVNYAAYRAARDVWSGAVQTSVVGGRLDGARFVRDTVCPAVGALLDCTRILADVEPVSTDFWRFRPAPFSDGSRLTVRNWGVCTGAPGAAVLVQLLYPGPVLVGRYIPYFTIRYDGKPVHPTYAAMAMVNQTGYAQLQTCG